jgi:hypothetical protein
MVLISKYRDFLSPMVVVTLNQSPEPVDLNSILQRDAVYSCIGLGAYDLFNYINFDDW